MVRMRRVPYSFLEAFFKQIAGGDALAEVSINACGYLPVGTTFTLGWTGSRSFLLC